jgi:hypothetical protein
MEPAFLDGSFAKGGPRAAPRDEGLLSRRAPLGKPGKQKRFTRRARRSRGAALSVVRQNEPLREVRAGSPMPTGAKPSEPARNPGLRYRTLGDMAQAGDHHQRALAIDEKTRPSRRTGNQLRNLGLIFADQGNIARTVARHAISLSGWHGAVGSLIVPGSSRCHGLAARGGAAPLHQSWP